MQTNHKDAPKGCGCPKCRAGKHTAWGQMVRLNANRAQRHMANELLGLLVRTNSLTDVEVSPIRMGYTD